MEEIESASADGTIFVSDSELPGYDRRSLRDRTGGDMRKPKLQPRALPNAPASSPAEAQAQLDFFLDKYDPEVASFARRALAKMRKLVPGAIEMVYDNFNWLVIGFGPSERPSEAFFSLVLPPGRVSLCFLQGAGLPDPAKRLEGKGNLVRNIPLYSLGKPDQRVLDHPEVLDLINVALNRAKVSMPSSPRRKLIIRSISANQRPRRSTKRKK